MVKESIFFYIVQYSWAPPVRGTTMYGIWHKLKRLKYGVRTLSKKYSDISSRVVDGRSKLGQVQTLFVNDGFNSKSITDAKLLNEEMLSLQQVEEEILAQKAKLEWLQLGDGNNSYFNASIKDKNIQKGVYRMERLDGQTICTPVGIEKEVIDFYNTAMVGYPSSVTHDVNVVALRRGKSVSWEKARYLIRHVPEVFGAMHGIGIHKVMYRWVWFSILQRLLAHHQTDDLHELFVEGKLLAAFNCTIVTLIPKIN